LLGSGRTGGAADGGARPGRRVVLARHARGEQVEPDALDPLRRRARQRGRRRHG
jgi:hypothetical protein